MGISDENNPTNVQEMGSRKFDFENRNNRRALGVINQNLGGTHQYPCVANKRLLSETNGISDKNIHRPITRKFAAQLANRNYPEDVKKLKASEDSFSVWEDCPLTDVKEHGEEAAKDKPVPMALEQTQAMLKEKDQMEIEMEDIFEEALTDIDSNDADDPLAVVEYVGDLCDHHKKLELEEVKRFFRKYKGCRIKIHGSSSCVAPDYMEQQFDINEKMRAILVDWLIEVHHKFELREETLFLTVNLIDRFLAKQSVVRKKLQLVGLVGMLLACKYEEVSVPIVDDLVFISDKAYSRKEVLEMERLMLITLQFNMSVPTPYVFTRRFLKAAQSDKKLELLSLYLIELCLVEYEMLRYTPSFLAASAIYTAQCALYGVRQWSKTCEWHTTYSEDQLLECSRQIVEFHQKATTGKLTGVHRKYNTSKFGYVARCEPVDFLLES